ncbi:MAG TPA: type II toxin-antitoxin system PemK/MazF family toxin [Acidimicrobiales bacterium]|nr:type II toxin-antitoxin system PemK/MazF family toxin [Acidimicrobiales bacterium]
MRRGDVVLIDLDPARPGESAKTRPAVLVSNDGANRTGEQLGRGVVTVVPLTTNVRRVYAFQVLLPAGSAGLRRASKAQAEQVRSVSVDRIVDTIGHLELESMRDLDDALRLHLDL